MTENDPVTCTITGDSGWVTVHLIQHGFEWMFLSIQTAYVYLRDCGLLKPNYLVRIDIEACHMEVRDEAGWAIALLSV